MAGKQQARTGRRVFTWLMVSAVFLLLLPKRLTDRVDQMAAAVLAPLSAGGQNLSLAVTENLPQGGPQSVPAEQYERLEGQYRQLEKNLANLREVMQRQEELIEKLSGMRQQFGMARVGLIQAEVVGSDSSNARDIKNVKVNQGSLQRIQTGQMVLAREARSGATSVYQTSIVGRICDVGLQTARVQMVSDPGFRMEVAVAPQPGRKETWRAGGILKGQALGDIRVTMASVQDHPVQVGDAVVAKSQPNYLPVEMVVGTVKSCRRDDRNPVMWEITVEPGVDLRSLREVFVVDMQGKP